jgi:hypothetical protein
MTLNPISALTRAFCWLEGLLEVRARTADIYFVLYNSILGYFFDVFTMPIPRRDDCYIDGMELREHSNMPLVGMFLHINAIVGCVS